MSFAQGLSISLRYYLRHFLRSSRSAANFDFRMLSKHMDRAAAALERPL